MSSHFNPDKISTFNPILSNPNFLQAIANCNIRLIAPASGTTPENIEALRSLSMLSSALRFKFPKNLNSDVIAFHANTDEERLHCLREALYDDNSNDIIWALRGGYGTARLLNELAKLPKPSKEKILIGCSDITALHLFLTQQWNWRTLHGPVLLELLHLDRDPQNLLKVLDIIHKNVSCTKITNLKLLNPNKVYAEKITGRITGGNLTIVQTSIGTPWQIQTKDKIIFLEDVGEKGYYIDRALNHLRQAGMLAGIKAIVFGEFFAPRDDKTDLALTRFAADTDIPVFKTNQFGHGKHNHPLIYNAESEILQEAESDDHCLKIHI